MKILKAITLIVSATIISACSIQAPPYQPSLENVQQLKTSQLPPMKVGKFGGKESTSSISLRGTQMSSPLGKSYGLYLNNALEQELKLANLWSGVSNIVVSGEILNNDINVAGFSTGTGEMSVEFIITKKDDEIFKKIINSNITFDSSFVGAIAIPNGQANYANLVQSIIIKLVNDEQFLNSLK